MIALEYLHCTPSELRSRVAGMRELQQIRAYHRWQARRQAEQMRKAEKGR